MNTLHITELKARFHLPADDVEVRARLDRTLRRITQESLENAVRTANIGSTEEVCIRSVATPVRLKLQAQDTTLEHEWSTAIASSIRSRIDRGGPGVVCYRNRRHAVLDMAIGVAAGDYSRAWAWRQLGLWDGKDTVSQLQAGGELTHALLAEANAIIATIATIARGGALPRLLRILPQTAWKKLAKAALEAAGVGRVGDFDGAAISSVSAVESANPAGARPNAADAAPAPRPAARVAEEVLRTSWISRGLAGVEIRDGEVLSAIATLAILETDASSLERQYGRSGELLSGVVARLVTQRDGSANAPLGPETTGVPRQRGVLDRGENPSHPRYRGRSMDSDAPPAGRIRRASAASSDKSEPDASSDSRTDGRQLEATGGDDVNEPFQLADQSSSGDTAETERELPDLDASVATEVGGIFFFHHIVAELGLPREIAESVTLAQRSARWVIQRVIAGLLGLHPCEPAILAFVGLSLSGGDPFAVDDAPTPVEQAELDELSSRVALRFLERVTESGGALRGPVRETIMAYSRRSAEIVPSPGWIEVRLRVDEVDVAIRRAGLDLDPGWIPWLGVVVKLVYE